MKHFIEIPKNKVYYRILVAIADEPKKAYAEGISKIIDKKTPNTHKQLLILEGKGFIQRIKLRKANQHNTKRYKINGDKLTSIFWKWFKEEYKLTIEERNPEFFNSGNLFKKKRTALFGEFLVKLMSQSTLFTPLDKPPTTLEGLFKSFSDTINVSLLDMAFYDIDVEEPTEEIIKLISNKKEREEFEKEVQNFFHELMFIAEMTGAFSMTGIFKSSIMRLWFDKKNALKFEKKSIDEEKYKELQKEQKEKTREIQNELVSKDKELIEKLNKEFIHRYGRLHQYEKEFTQEIIEDK